MAVGERIQTSQSGAQFNAPYERNKAKALLKTLIPVARGLARKGSNAGAAFNSHITEQMRHMRIDNLVGLFVYETVDGWYCDVLLKDVPFGISKVFGTPSTAPHSSKKGAVELGISLLAHCMELEAGDTIKQVRPAPPDTRYFSLDGVGINIPEPLFAMVALDFVAKGLDRAAAEHVLKLELLKEFPEGITTETWNKLGKARQTEYAILCCGLLAHGQFRVVVNDMPMGSYDQMQAETLKELGL